MCGKFARHNWILSTVYANIHPQTWCKGVIHKPMWTWKEVPGVIIITHYYISLIFLMDHNGGGGQIWGICQDIVHMVYG